MNLTGKWPEKNDSESEGDVYSRLCIPIKAGKVDLADIKEDKKSEVLDLIVQHSIEPGKDRLEDYPKDWQELLRNHMGDQGSGSEI